MKKLILYFTLFLLIWLTFSLTVTAQIVKIPDPNLRAKIEDALGKASGATITAADMATLKRLEPRDANISDLTGLEGATNLTKLDLTRNSVSNIAPIANLTKLTHLDLDGNAISDISAVVGLTNLTFLDIWGTSISDISPVAGLTNLTGLYLPSNQITDISSLSDLTNLKTLWLQNNWISDLAPLVANTGLGSGDTVDVRGNRLNDQSLHTHIPALQSRGVTVEFDNRIPPPPINTNGMVQGDVPFANEPFDVNNIPEPVPPPKEVRDFFDLAPYYQQWVNVSGFPILASAEVSPYALKEVAWILGHMIEYRPDVLRVMVERTVRFSIIPHNKHTSDMPESNTGRLSFFRDVRSRGIYCKGCPIVGAPEEELIGKFSTSIHGFGHLLQDWGLNGVDPTFDNQVRTLFYMAKAEGLYQGRYAGSDPAEYWAEGVASWFHDTQPKNVAHTRLALKKYDPRLAKLLTEVFGDGDWRYTQPATRTHLPHLQGFNPQEAPIYQRPTRLLELEAQLKDPTSDGGGKWVNLKLYDPSALSHLKKLTTGRNHTDLIFGNFTGTDLTLYTIYDNGKRALRHYSTTDDLTAFDTHVGAIWLIQDHTGKDFAVFRAEKEVGRVLVTPTLRLITPGLSIVSGDNQSGIPGTVLANPFVVEVRDQNLSTLEGISVTFTITAGDGTLSVTHTTTDGNGRAESILTLGSNFGTNTVSATGIEGTVTFNAAAEPPVNIPNPYLRAEVLTTLGKPKNDPITPSEMATLTELRAPNANISDLTGLEFATNLTTLNLGHVRVGAEGRPINSNSLSNISLLAGLTNLTELRLGYNLIENISPLVGLTNLTFLDLTGNSVSNIAPIASLTQLTYLDLDGNPLSDISAVTDLTNLTFLDIWGTPLSDISPVASLTNLTLLGLGGNNISNLSPLVANTGLRNGDKVYVQGNPLSYQSIHTHIPNLQSRGVTVEFDNRTHPALLKISGDSQKGAAFTSLSQPFIVEAQDANGSALAGIPVTFAVTAGDGTLSVTRATTDKNGRAESTLTLGTNVGTNTVSVSASGIEGTVTFNATMEAAVNILDTNLRAAIETALGKAEDDPIAPSEMTTLTRLEAKNANISDLTGLEHATNLTRLLLENNNISDLSPIADLTQLSLLYLGGNSITDLSPIAGLTKLTNLTLGVNNISDISPLTRLTNLEWLNLADNTISDISVLAGLPNLTYLALGYNAITDHSILSGLTNLIGLDLRGTNTSDLSVLADLTKLERLYIDRNGISNLSPLAGLTNLTDLALNSNSISDLSPLRGLTNLSWMRLVGNNITDLSPLVANTGLGEGDWIDVKENPLSYQSIHTHIPTLQDRGVTVEFDNQTHPALLKISGDNQKGAASALLSQPFVVEAQDANGSALVGVSVTFAVTVGDGTLNPTITRTNTNGRAQSTLTLGPNLGTNTVQVSATGIQGKVTFHAISDNLPTEFLLSIPAGTNLIHVPLQVTTVNGIAKTIESVSDLYDALGGADTVNFLITHAPATQGWFNYFNPQDKGTAADKLLTHDTGIMANMKAPVSIRLSGDALGTNGSSIITLHPDMNLVGLPLRDARIARVSDLLMLDGIRGNVPAITVLEGGVLKEVSRAGDDGDIEITGGQSFILRAQRAATVAISGGGWYNSSTIAAAPPMVLSGIRVTDTTPILALRGSIVDEGTGVIKAGLHVKVKNLSTDRALSTVIGDEGNGYQLTVVDVETGRAAQIGDILEILAQSPNPFIGVKPLQYTVTAEDVKQSLIQLPALVAYEIPAETELLANYPNPFNPETWIPYRLAEDAFVTLTIYDKAGQGVRTLEIGHRIASAYENRSNAIYWDGRNDVGERVASGVYFYTLSAGEYFATRRMLIIK